METDKIQELTNEWLAAKQKAEEAKKVIEEEKQLRQKLFEVLNPNAKEGTDNHLFSNGTVLKTSCKHTRTIDKDALILVEPKFKELGIDIASLISWHPKLNMEMYRYLSDNQRQVFDAALIIKPSMPTITKVEIKK